MNTPPALPPASTPASNGGPARQPAPSPAVVRQSFPLGGHSWRSAPIEVVAEHSPLVALARMKRIQFAPWVLNVRATFNEAAAGTTVGPATWLVSNGTERTRLAQFAIVDRLMHQIYQPSFDSGAELKSLADYYFELQSGIEATLIVDGQPSYVVAPDFTPIKTLASMLGEAWPMGWVLQPTQAAKMQFTANQALPTTPTTIVISYRLWTPIGTTEFINMSEHEAAKQLKSQFGIDCAPIVRCGAGY